MTDDPPSDVPTDLTSGDADVAITQQLLREETAGARLQVEVGPFSTYILVVAAQMVARAARGPQAASQVAMFRTATLDLESALHGTAAGDLLAAGWRELGLT